MIITLNHYLFISGLLFAIGFAGVLLRRNIIIIFMGEPTTRTLAWTDTIGLARWPIILLIATLMITGFAPRTLLSFVKPSVQALLPVK